MKIHCPNFVLRSGCFYQVSVQVCPKQLPFPSFQGNFTSLLFAEIFAFSAKKSQYEGPPLPFISGFFCGIKENSILLSGILMVSDILMKF